MYYLNAQVPGTDPHKQCKNNVHTVRQSIASRAEFEVTSSELGQYKNLLATHR